MRNQVALYSLPEEAPSETCLYSEVRQRALVIDDCAAFSEMLTSVLEEWGYEVARASNGLEGWARICADQPQVILLDRTMPLLDGEGVLARLAADPRRCDTRVIVMSGDSDAWSALTMDCGLLKKPFSLDDLAQALDATWPISR
jgi:CheY-like chemotaxis protein